MRSAPPESPEFGVSPSIPECSFGCLAPSPTRAYSKRQETVFSCPQGPNLRCTAPHGALDVQDTSLRTALQPLTEGIANPSTSFHSRSPMQGCSGPSLPYAGLRIASTPVSTGGPAQTHPYSSRRPGTPLSPILPTVFFWSRGCSSRPSCAANSFASRTSSTGVQPVTLVCPFM